MSYVIKMPYYIWGHFKKFIQSSEKINWGVKHLITKPSLQ